MKCGTCGEKQGLGLARDAVLSVSQPPEAFHRHSGIPHRHPDTHSLSSPCVCGREIQGRRRRTDTDFPPPGELLLPWELAACHLVSEAFLGNQASALCAHRPCTQFLAQSPSISQCHPHRDGPLTPSPHVQPSFPSRLRELTESPIPGTCPALLPNPPLGFHSQSSQKALVNPPSLSPLC